MAHSNIKKASAVHEQSQSKQEAFFLKFRKQILIAVTVVVVVVAGYVIYNTFLSGPREEKASTALAKLGGFRSGDFQKASNGTRSEGFLRG